MSSSFNISLRRTVLASLSLGISATQAQSDSFATATVITALPETGTNAGATKEGGEINHANNAGGASVWYSWTAPADGHYRVDLLGSTFDTLLGVYTGTAVDSLLEVTHNDDRTGGGTTSAAVIYARTGDQFYIAIDGYFATATGAATGTISLNISPLPANEVPPANDLFSNAASLGSALSAVQTVSTLYGSRERGERLIAGKTGASSLWWQWTAPVTGEIEVSTAGSALNTLLAVYTGNAIDSLTVVGENDNAGTLTTSQVIFTAQAGTQYYFAADVSNATFTIPSGNLNLRLSSNLYVSTLIPFNAAWSWLHPAGGVDPASTDPDFATTWHTPASYNGPAFSATEGGAILGYGGIDYGTTVTNISDPGTGSRYSAYFRRSFNAAQNSSRLRAEVLADDGAIIYLDGTEVGRVNMDPVAPDAYTLLALNATATETSPVTVDLGAITAGDHQIAVSVHNAGPTSSDLGFALRLFSDTTPAPVDFVLGPAGALIGFEEPFAGASSYLFGSNGNTEPGWTSTGGVVQGPSGHPATVTPAPSSQYFRLNAASANPFLTDKFSLAGVSAEDKARLTASVDVRTFTTSTTTFEVEDKLTVSLQGSTDGTTFNTLADVLPLTTGGTPDNLIAISAVSGNYVTFSTAAGAVTPDIAFLRVSITGSTDSTSEYIYLDNLRLAFGTALDPAGDADGDGQSNGAEAIAGTDPLNPTSVLSISGGVNTTGGWDLTFPAVAGKTYLVEYTPDFVIPWTTLLDNIAPAAAGSYTVSDVALPAGTRGFLRVRVKP